MPTKLVIELLLPFFLVPPMLDEAIGFLEERVKNVPAFKYEIIVVSDGSRDSTVKVVESYVEKYGSDKVRCLELIKNRGKGGAVRLVSTPLKINKKKTILKL